MLVAPFIPIFPKTIVLTLPTAKVLAVVVLFVKLIVEDAALNVKLAIIFVVFYGGYKMYKHCDPTTISLLTLFINICLISTIYIFLSKHYTINLHVLLHLFSSIGHHLILFL